MVGGVYIWEIKGGFSQFFFGVFLFCFVSFLLNNGI